MQISYDLKKNGRMERQAAYIALPVRKHHGNLRVMLSIFRGQALKYRFFLMGREMYFYIEYFFFFLVVSSHEFILCGYVVTRSSITALFFPHLHLLQSV